MKRQQATVFATDCPQIRGADFGIVLINVDSPLAFMLPNIPGPIAQITTTVTNDPAMCGRMLYTQAKLHGVAARPFIVTNSQDLLIGSN